MSKKLKIDDSVCIGCSSCESVAPKYFKVEDGIAIVTKQYDEKDDDEIKEAIDICPVQAILLEK